MTAKRIIQELKNRFPISTGSLFNFKDGVTIITLENLEFALNRLKEEGKILFLSGGFHDVEEFYREEEKKAK